MYNLPSMETVKLQGSRKLFNVISLFAGAGGSSTGYRLAGGNILAINEFISHARKIYKTNYPETLIFPQDIRDLTSEEIMVRTNIKVGELDILDGSPPCSSFSINGKREKFWGEIKNYSNTKQRTDDLFLEFAKKVNVIKPKVFIAENVKGIISGKAKDMFDMFKESLTDCGYNVGYKLLDAYDYGVPQNRERVFMIGVRNDLNLSPVFPEPCENRISAKQAIGDLLNCGTDDTCSTTSKRFVIMNEFFPAGTDSKRVMWVKQNCKYEGKIFEQHYRRDRWDRPFYTIKQHHYRPFHPVVDRTLSVSESKRLQSFPDDFIFPLTPNKNWEFVGRAVPPLLMKAIAEAVYNKILK